MWRRALSLANEWAVPIVLVPSLVVILVLFVAMVSKWLCGP